MISPSRPLLYRLAAALLLVACILGAGCTDITGGSHGSSLRQGTTGDLRAYFLDVGQGDSSVILFRDKVILIDAGEIDYGDTVVNDLNRLGIKKIDLLVATHPHSDHIGGMKKVLANFPVASVLDSGIPSSSTLYEQFLATIEKKGIPYRVAEQGQTIDVDPSLQILVLSPPKKLVSDDINTNSIVLRISYGTVSFLYTGDATAAAEDVMLRAGYPLDARVLKVGHHGSSGSSSAAFLARVNPDVAVISLGKDNDYGHPHKETLARLAAAGPEVFRTDTDGTISVVSNGNTFSVTTESGDAGFWNAPVLATTPSPANGTPPLTPATPVPAASPNMSNLVPEIPALPVTITIPATLPALQIGNASLVKITAIQFNAPGDDRENINGEWVQIRNNGDGPVLLAGWTLSDKDGTQFTFPAYLLLPGEPVTVFAGSGTMNDTALFMQKAEPVFANSGDEAVLRDGSGNIVDRRSA